MGARTKFTDGLEPRQWIYLLIIAAAILISARSYVSESFPKIVFSESESLEKSVFVVTQASGDLERGDYVTFRIPENPFMDQVSVTKIIRGLPGDEIIIKDRWIYVAGEKIGRAKDKTRAGLDLTPIEAGVIAQGQYFVAGTHIDSYDSRYKSFGLISSYQIGGKAEPIF